MLLCDVGNTSYHFLNEQEDYKESTKTFKPGTVTQKVYYICVHPKIAQVLKGLSNWVDLSLYVDMKKYYNTMGIDRIFACEAIADGVIVDAGSAITVDVVSENAFMGGFIYPGTLAMQEAYKKISTALDYEFNYELDLKTLAKNSQDAISYGYLKMLYSEVSLHNRKIYLTGGDAKKLLNIFPDAQIEETLIFDGMKKVLRSVL